MGLDNNLCLSARPIQMRGEGFNCLGHVPVTQVPRGDLFEEHGAVILLRVLYQAGVLLGIKSFFFRHDTIASSILRGMALEFDELADDLVLARFRDTGSCQEAIDLGILAAMIEAGIPYPGPLAGL